MANIPQLLTPWQDLFDKMLFIKPHLSFLLRNSETEEEESMLESYPIFDIDYEFDFYKTSEEIVIKEEIQEEEILEEETQQSISTFKSKGDGVVKQNCFITHKHKPPRESKRKVERDYPTLIEEVKKRPVLWSFSHPLHRNRIAMTKSWDEIGELLDQKCKFLKISKNSLIKYFTDEEGRKQWYYLVMKYKRQLEDELNANDLDDFEPCFEFYEMMSFLKRQFTKMMKDNAEQKLVPKTVSTAPHTVTKTVSTAPQTVTFQIHVEEEVKGNMEEDVKPNIKLEPIVVINEAEDMNMIAHIKEEPELSISDTQLTEATEDEAVFIEVIETLDEEDEDYSQIMLSEEGAPPVKKIKLPLEGDPKSDEDFFQSLLPYFKQMTAVQKKRIQNSIENMVLEEFK